MAAVRFLVRPALVAGAALTMVGALAAPAAAASVSCRLDGLPGRMTAGVTVAGLRALVTNPKPENIADIELVYTIRLDGLEADQVRFTKYLGSVKVSGGNGEVRVVDTARLSRQRATVLYGLQFLTSAPSGRASVSMDAYLRTFSGQGEHLGSTRASTSVQSARGTASPTKASPAPTGTLALGPADVLPGQSTPAVAPQGAVPTGGDGDSGLWPLYLVGFLLLAGGGGAAAFLLFRRPNEPGVDKAVAPYAGFAQLEAPTAILPAYAGERSGYPGSAYPGAAGSPGMPGPTGPVRPGGYGPPPGGFGGAAAGFGGPAGGASAGLGPHGSGGPPPGFGGPMGAGGGYPGAGGPDTGLGARLAASEPYSTGGPYPANGPYAAGPAQPDAVDPLSTRSTEALQPPHDPWDDEGRHPSDYRGGDRPY